MKFIFATTEIRKVPVTVLSRCQRFDLRRISVAELSAHYGRIAQREGVAMQPEALALIARAADGSARDGLSLLDQAIAQSAPGETITATAIIDMLGLADRGAIFDLLEAVLSGKPATALAITDQAHARGADLGEMLSDLLELVHTITRLKVVPDLRHGSELPEAERTRGATLADQLGMAALGRAWQMLLKGITEVEQAADRRAAAEMVLIRLCHVADLPPPAELIRQLREASPQAIGGAAPLAPSPGGTRAVANGAPRQAPQPEPGLPRPASFREVAALVEQAREPTLHAHLVHSVHLVRFAPPVIEIRPEPDTPRDLAARLSAVLGTITGLRWTVAVSSDAGEPTLAEQGDAADHARRANAAHHPMVVAILQAFPGAKIEAVTDTATDRYGLPMPNLGGDPEPEGFDLPPPGTDEADEPADFWEIAP